MRRAAGRRPARRATTSRRTAGGGSFALAARLSLTGEPVTGAGLARVLPRYPAMTAEVIGGIYWQAPRRRL